jgi:hypothetical protein
MILTTTYRGIEFIGAEKDHALLHEWYGQLQDSEVKASITKIKWREFRPYDQAIFWT